MRKIGKKYELRFIERIFAPIHYDKTEQFKINSTNQIFIKIKFLRSIYTSALPFTLLTAIELCIEIQSPVICLQIRPIVLIKKSIFFLMVI